MLHVRIVRKNALNSEFAKFSRAFHDLLPVFFNWGLIEDPRWFSSLPQPNCSS
jgi:hypothetical protein